jgi:hypothetical protein
MLSEILVSVAAKQQLTPLEAACGPTPVDNWSATAAARLGKPYTWRTAKKAEALSRQVFELGVKLGPEYISLVSSLKDVEIQIPNKLRR